MKLPILCLATCLVSTPVFAQSLNTPNLGGSSPGFAYYQLTNPQPLHYGSHYTPTMQRQHVAQAIALRQEAAILAAADGGTLSARNQRYIQKKADKILGY